MSCSRPRTMRGVIRCLVLSIIAISFGAIASPALAQAPANEAQVKAAFVYNFLKFIEWPSNTFVGPQDSLIVGIIGGGTTANATARLLAGKLVSGRPIGIRRLEAGDAIGAFHAIFIGELEPRSAERALNAVEADAILSIGEDPGFVHRGGIIGLLVEGQRVRFEINADAAERASLKISSKLLALARIVNPQPAADSTR